MSSLIPEIKASLRQIDASALKRMGQNFMVSEETIAFIADSLGLQKGDSVVEIGPGLGFLTQEFLNKGVRVTAIEKDRKYAEFLKKKFKDKEFKVIEADVLKTDLRVYCPAKTKIAGNIPYNITSPILEWLIENRGRVQDVVLTVQWEVAERLVARQGTKAWGSLSIFLQFYADVAVLKKVGPNAFYPAPKVDSAVIKLSFLEKPRVNIENEVLFFQIVRRAFQKRRKTLLNALESETHTKALLGPVFSLLHIDPMRRPETLSLEEWANLSLNLP